MSTRKIKKSFYNLLTQTNELWLRLSRHCHVNLSVNVFGQFLCFHASTEIRIKSKNNASILLVSWKPRCASDLILVSWCHSRSSSRSMENPTLSYTIAKPRNRSFFSLHCVHPLAKRLRVVRPITTL